MPPSIHTDLSFFPLVLVRLPDADVTDDDVRRFIADQRAMLGRRARHGVIADASRARAVTARQRKLMADWLEEADPLNRAYTVCIAIVLDNALIRGALTAVLWLKQPGSPTKVFARIDEAADWVLAELERAGVADVTRAKAFASRGKSAHIAP